MSIVSRLTHNIFLLGHIVFLLGKALLVLLKLIAAFVLLRTAPYYLALFFLISFILYNIFFDAEDAFEDASNQKISGPARVIDGDTIEVNGTRIRFHGLDAPELDQKLWGDFASDMLRHIVDSNGGTVQCSGYQRNRDSRMDAVCASGDIPDIGEALVVSGAAFAHYLYPDRYTKAEAMAKKLRLGVWSPDFQKLWGPIQKPWEWRRQRKNGRLPE
ncbi:thermonuclease family protein [Rhodospirillaceae bacterium AH-315-P19]|nr:thermonuclease family protein [Rhodospirillaceae bacterium AH-315-P19]